MNGLSIIIPTLNEAACIRDLLKSLPLEQHTVEVVVVDGGSVDNTLDMLADFPVKIINCAFSGRGHQLALGIQQASNTLIWLLHADSKVGTRHVDAIFKAMSDTAYIGGNFAIEFDGADKFSLWLNRFYAAIRKRGFYYGDSGIFIRRETLDVLGGITPRTLMEDYALVRKMEACRGKTLCIETPRIVSSSRRFTGRSRGNIICGWIIIHMLYYLRFPDTWLVKIYNAKWFSAKA